MTQRLRNLIREIEMKRQLAAVGEFATQLSHEIRNPLMSLQLELQGLRREVERGEFGDDAGRSLDTCLREVRRLDRVAHGALALGRPRELRCTRRELETLADCAAAALQAELQSRNIIMEKRVECDYTMVDADPEAIEGAIINLLRNAAEAQPQGGRILLLIREAEVGLPPLSPHSHQLDPGKCIELIVADDGPGIPAHIGDRVFHPFVSSKEQGTGIGVPLALRVAQDHGGTVTIHPDGVHGYRGAAFCVRLPRAHEPDSD
jgi:signal transduction histidine kinase